MTDHNPIRHCKGGNISFPICVFDDNHYNEKRQYKNERCFFKRFNWLSNAHKI